MKQFLLIMILCGCGVCFAQQPAATNIRHSDFPKVDKECKVYFQTSAPEAKEVIADIGGKKYAMTKDPKGVWSVVTNPQQRGINYYSIIIDGVSVNDPLSETAYGCSRMTSVIEIPYKEGDTRFELKEVEHGEISMRRYFSKTENAWRRMFIYLPPTYNKSSNTKYPVMYLQHGGGEDERGWAVQGKTDIILDNLIAEGKAKEMIIVMCDGNCKNFADELINECIPVIEKNYRVYTDAAHRAMAGLSMGGIQTLNLAVEHPELFSYIGVFSSGWFADASHSFMPMNTEKYYKKLEEKSDFYNKQFKVFWLSIGDKEDIAYNNCMAMLGRFDKIGIKYTFYNTSGGHTWPVWRESLWNFAQMIF